MLLLNFHTHRLSVPGETALCSAAPADFAALLLADAGGTTRFSLGFHPWRAAGLTEADWEALRRALRHPAVCAVGEAGLDRCCPVAPEVQREVFRRQILWAEEARLPMVLHVVRAVDDVLALRRLTGARQPWVWHGFRGGPWQMEQLLRHGFWFSFGPSHRAESLARCPADRLLLETDEARTPVADLYRTAAALRGIAPDELARQLRRNFGTLFPACPLPDAG